MIVEWRKKNASQHQELFTYLCELEQITMMNVNLKCFTSSEKIDTEAYSDTWCGSVLPRWHSPHRCCQLGKYNPKSLNYYYGPRKIVQRLKNPISATKNWQAFFTIVHIVWVWFFSPWKKRRLCFIKSLFYSISVCHLIVEVQDNFNFFLFSF